MKKMTGLSESQLDAVWTNKMGVIMVVKKFNVASDWILKHKDRGRSIGSFRTKVVLRSGFRPFRNHEADFIF
jgi:hypothetical protein